MISKFRLCNQSGAILPVQFCMTNSEQAPVGVTDIDMETKERHTRYVCRHHHGIIGFINVQNELLIADAILARFASNLALTLLRIYVLTAK